MLELYGTRTCPYTYELREDLVWDDLIFVEYDIGIDGEARARLRALAPETTAVPVLIEDGCVLQIGHQGRSCEVSLA